MNKARFLRYDEDTNSMILLIPRESMLEEMLGGIKIAILADQTTIGLWKCLGIEKCQKWLWENQGRKCADRGRALASPRSLSSQLHHDPALGKRDAKAIDYKQTTRNRVLCRSCHSKTEAKKRFLR